MTDGSRFNKREVGRSGEENACKLLIEKGFFIVEQNYFAGRNGEIDIIALKDDLLLFVEVKSRFSDTDFGDPLYSISPKKVSSIKKAAQHFLVENSKYHSESYTCRFDLISIRNDDAEWFEDIIR